MNLKQIFNFKYLYQNLKKSKAFLCVFIGLVPIITLLMMIGYGTSDNLYIPQLEELSIINYPCMYILPIIIAICLNGHVFKKKTVDFINSMPISRKTLFFTNVLGGIILLVLMNLIN